MHKHIASVAKILSILFCNSFNLTAFLKILYIIFNKNVKNNAIDNSSGQGCGACDLQMAHLEVAVSDPQQMCEIKLFL